MIVPFRQRLEDHTRALQEVCPYPRTTDFLPPVKKDLRNVDERTSGRQCVQPTWIYFPNRDELSLRVVLALPKASRAGFVARICLSTSLASSKETLVLPFPPAEGGFTEAMYRMINLADSVFPAPLLGSESAVLRLSAWSCTSLQRR